MCHMVGLEFYSVLGAASSYDWKQYVCCYKCRRWVKTIVWLECRRENATLLVDRMWYVLLNLVD